MSDRSEPVVLYGISNCDTIRKARRWLDERGVDYRFHDYRKAGTDRTLLEQWSDEFGWDKLVNRRGTTWRQLDPGRRDALDRASAIDLMMEQPSVIKRPVLVCGEQRLLGFDPDCYAKVL